MTKLFGERATVAFIMFVACVVCAGSQLFSRADVVPAGAGTSNGVTPHMQIYYLEIVTNDMDVVCAAYAAATGVKFGEPDVALGNARTAPMPGGGLAGVRAPLRETEQPIVRPYWLVEDIEASVAQIEKAGGRIALPPTKLAGHGTCAIYTLGGVNHGLWQK